MVQWVRPSLRITIHIIRPIPTGTGVAATASNDYMTSLSLGAGY
jgi:hypothetical protein